MIVSLDCYFTRKRAAYLHHFYRFLDVFIFLKLLGSICNTIRELYKNKTSEYFNAFAVLFKTIPCNKPKIYFMKNYALNFIPSLFVSSCNNTKAADEKKK
jgi:hypothetical protein